MWLVEAFDDWVLGTIKICFVILTSSHTPKAKQITAIGSHICEFLEKKTPTVIGRSIWWLGIGYSWIVAF